MKYEKRKLIHEYSEHFGCESVAYDAEPNRNVVATALKEKVIFIKYLFNFLILNYTDFLNFFHSHGFPIIVW